MKIKKEIIIALNLIIITLLLNQFNILLEHPKNNVHLIDKEIELKWNGDYENYTVYIDENKNFETPVIKKITGNSYIIDELDFGTYYWKVEKNNISSQVWKFTVYSKVAINMIEKENSVEIENVGNTDIDLEVRNPITGVVTLDLPYEKSKEFEKDNTIFIGKQK